MSEVKPGNLLDERTEYQNFSMKPVPATLFFRTFPLWQFVRFIWINVLMVIMIQKSHEKKMKKD